jgi:hypothetical protein
MKKQVRIVAVAIIPLLLASCTDAIKLRNYRTGQIAQCGPYTSDMLGNGAVNVLRDSECIRDFQRQGYERMP